jgi:nucleotide-binding universal stress UspA family protein
VAVVHLAGRAGHDSGTTLVVGFDRSPEARAALACAAELGTRLGAHLHVVHAVSLDDYPIDPDVEDWEGQARKMLEEERTDLVAILNDHPCGWSYVAGRGNPVRLLMESADEHDALMIVVGTRGEGLRGAAHRLFGPSISHGLIGHAERPVLVVTEPSGPEPAGQAIRATTADSSK